jgi:hypothetical protein
VQRAYGLYHRASETAHVNINRIISSANYHTWQFDQKHKRNEEGKEDEKRVPTKCYCMCEDGTGGIESKK